MSRCKICEQFCDWICGMPDDPKELLPDNVREASHDASNEITKFNAVIRRLASEDDPFKAFVDRMHEAAHRSPHAGR